jgi:hypothetical protein
MWPYSAFGVFTAATVRKASTFLSRRLATTAGTPGPATTSATVPSAV